MHEISFCYDDNDGGDDDVDEVGIDISNHVGAFMSKADLGDRMLGGDPEMMSKMVEKGWLGRKTGKGFYLYPKNPKKGEKKQLNPEMLAMLKEELGKRGVGKCDVSVEDMQWRIMTRFVNEAAYCLQDGIIRAPADGTYLLPLPLRTHFLVDSILMHVWVIPCGIDGIKVSMYSVTAFVYSESSPLNII